MIPNKVNPLDFTKTFLVANNRTSVRAVSRFLNNARRYWFTGTEIAQVYGFPKPSNRPIVVGVMSNYGLLYGNIDENGLLTGGDVQAYWTSLGIPEAKQPRVIIVKNRPSYTLPSEEPLATAQNTSVIEIIGACCPTSNLTIILYDFQLNSLEDFANTFTYVVDNRVNYGGQHLLPTVVYSPFILPEYLYSGYPSMFQTIDVALAAGIQKKITFCFPANPDDISYSDYNVPYFPSSSPNVVTVGGTSLVCPTLKYDKFTRETAWIAGGGTVSALYDKPAYQNKLPGTRRAIPDIAFNADPNTGIKVLINGAEKVVGGNSISAAIFTGLLATYNKPKARLMNEYLYKLDNGVFNDIVSGATTESITVTPGWDLATGRGSIRGARFAG